MTDEKRARELAFLHMQTSASILESVAKIIRDTSAGVADGSQGIGSLLGMQAGIANASGEAVRELGMAVLQIADGKGGIQ